MNSMGGAVAEQFSLFPDLPVTEPKRVKSRWAELDEMVAVNDREDVEGLVPLFVAACLLDVSHQRVSQMVAEERLRTWEFFGKKFVCVNDLASYIKSERKAGRPHKDPPATLKEAFKAVKKVMKPTAK